MESSIAFWPCRKNRIINFNQGENMKNYLICIIVILLIISAAIEHDCQPDIGAEQITFYNITNPVDFTLSAAPNHNSQCEYYWTC
jgi:hypothetical protein